MKDKKDYKPYTAKRWTDIPIPTVIGPAEKFTEEEEKRIDIEATETLRKYGVISEDEIVKGDKVIKIDATSQ